MRILLTNDDGIYAPGLWALHVALSRGARGDGGRPGPRAYGGGPRDHAAPAAAGGAPGRERAEGYAVNGTPADCVKLAVLEILDGRPDLVVSGLNPGANVGVNINYSGTVAAAERPRWAGSRP